MNNAASILESAISDVGYWRWWHEALPGFFQVEFGGVQLWTPPTKDDRPPPGIIGLGFKDPTLVAFLTELSAAALQSDWRLALHQDQIEPFTVTYDEFTLSQADQVKSMTDGCSIEFLVGSEFDLIPKEGSSFLAFRAGPVGLVVVAEQMAVASSSGDLSSAEKIASSNAAWWEYWKDYWQRRDSDSPLPKDYACEVTIPRDQFTFKEV
jgi:hypothetical protein